MSKLALLICADDPTKPSSSSADAAAFKRAICKFWGFNDSEIVFLSSDGTGNAPATRAEVENQFVKALQIEELESLIVGFWGRGVIEPGQNKRRFCLSEFDFAGDPANWAANIKDTTVSLGSLLSATLKLHAHDAVFLIDCRPLNSEGEPWTLEAEDCQTIRKYVRKTEPGYRCGVLCACSDGESPRDLVEGRKGLFTAKLIEGIQEGADRFQSSFDSVSGYVVQKTKEEAAKMGARQFPLYECAGDGDIRFEITKGHRADENFDAYGDALAAEPEPETVSELVEDSIIADSTVNVAPKKRSDKRVGMLVGAAVLAVVVIGVAAWALLR